MSIKRVLLLLTAVMSVITVANAQTFTMTGGDRETVSAGDTLVVPDGQDVSIAIESKSRLLVKGGSSMSLRGGDGALVVTLDDGQIFLDRGKPHELASVSVYVKGITFTPAGTAVAVKTTPQGAPTAAVLRGSVVMTDAQGETMTVGARQFGTVNSVGKLAFGELNERGIAQLEAWTGVKAEPAPVIDVGADGDAEAPEEVLGSAPESLPVRTASESVPPESGSAPELLSEQTPEPAASESSPSSPETAQAAEDGEHGDDDGKEPKPPRGDGWVKEWLDGFQPVPMFERPRFEFGAGITSVWNEAAQKNETWTRLLLGVDVSIWRFGVFLDFEMFIDGNGDISNKAWDFKDDAADALLRKIRYIRFGHEKDPLFIKFGGLSSVTTGYGIIVDRFSNMLNYPDEKLLGLQVHVNDFSPIGLSLQTMISDFAEVGDGGGVYAGRLSVRPLKAVAEDIPIVNRLTVGGTYAFDRDAYSQVKDASYADSSRNFGLYGFDIGLPIINNKLIDVTLYAQYASRTDDTRGWGTGAPGVLVNIWRLNAVAEYRKAEGRFTHGFFDRYYLDERIHNVSRQWQDKSRYIDSVSLNGVYGRLGMDVFGLLKAEGALQYMRGDRFINGGREDVTSRGYEATVSVGDAVMKFVPVIDLAEAYIRNSHIGMSGNLKYKKNGGVWEVNDYGELAGSFDRTPFLYWGYRAGIGMAGGMLIFDYRYGWRDVGGTLKSDNRLSLQAAYRY